LANTQPTTTNVGQKTTNQKCGRKKAFDMVAIMLATQSLVVLKTFLNG